PLDAAAGREILAIDLALHFRVLVDLRGGGRVVGDVSVDLRIGTERKIEAVEGDVTLHFAIDKGFLRADRKIAADFAFDGDTARGDPGIAADLGIVREDDDAAGGREPA